MNELTTLLRANGAFSAVSGAALLAGAGALDGTLGLETWFLAVCGVALLGYGATLWLVARTEPVVAAAQFATIMDAAWVVGASIILIGFPSAMTTLGRTALVAVSVVVADFALLQIRALRRPVSSTV